MPAPDSPRGAEFGRRRLEALLSGAPGASRQVDRLVAGGCKRRKLLALLEDVVSWCPPPGGRPSRIELAAARAEALAAEIDGCAMAGEAPASSQRLTDLLRRWAEAARGQRPDAGPSATLSPHLRRLAVQRLVRYVKKKTGRGRYRRLAMLLTVVTAEEWTAAAVKAET